MGKPTIGKGGGGLCSGGLGTSFGSIGLLSPIKNFWKPVGPDSSGGFGLGGLTSFTGRGGSGLTDGSVNNPRPTWGKSGGGGRSSSTGGPASGTEVCPVSCKIGRQRN